MTRLYLLASLPVAAVGVGLLALTTRWKRRAPENSPHWRAFFGLYFIGGCWVLMGVVLFIYGVLGVR